jgi:hypothetical protein
MTPPLAALLALPAQDAEPAGVTHIRRDAEAPAPLITTGLAGDFLKPPRRSALSAR